MSLKSIQEKMAENSRRWHEVDRETQQKLEKENQELSKEIDGATYDPDSGKWNALKYDDNSKGASGVQHIYNDVEKKDDRKNVSSAFTGSFGGYGSSSGSSFLGGSVTKQIDQVKDYQTGNLFDFSQVMDIVNDKLNLGKRLDSLAEQTKEQSEVEKAQATNDERVVDEYADAKASEDRMSLVYIGVFGFVVLAFISLFKN